MKLSRDVNCLIATMLLSLALVNLAYGSEINHLPSIQAFEQPVLENGQIEIDLNALVLDLDGDELIFTVTAAPQHGVITLVNNPKIPAIDLSKNSIVGHSFRALPSLLKYVPNANYTGKDEIAISALDRKGPAQYGKILLVIKPAAQLFLKSNQPPIVHNLSIEAHVGEPVSINLVSLAPDPDGDSLVANYQVPANFSNTRFHEDNFGLVLNHGRLYSVRERFFSYLPRTEGLDSFEYVVDDGHGHSVLGTVNVHNLPAISMHGIPQLLNKIVIVGFKIFFVCTFLFFLMFAVRRTREGAIKSLAIVFRKYGVYINVLLIFVMFNSAYIYYHYCRIILPPMTFDYAYYQIYDFFKYGILPPDTGIFLGRLAVPFLASFIPSTNPAFCFWVVNFLFMNLTVLLLYKTWQFLGIKQHLIFIAFFWLCFHPCGVTILYNLWPYSVDMAQYFFYSAFVYVILKRKYIWLLLLTPVATLHKETCLAIVLVFGFFALVHNITVKSNADKIPLLYLFVAIAISFLSKYLVAKFVIMSLRDFLVLDTLRSAWFAFLLRFGANFHFVIMWLIVQFYAFGGFLILALQSLKQVYKNTLVFNSMIFFCFVSFLISLLLSGTVERLSFNGYPFIMTLIVLVLNDLPVWLVGSAFVLSLPLLGLYAEPFDDTLSYSVMSEFGRMSLYGIYMLIVWKITAYLKGYGQVKGWHRY